MSTAATRHRHRHPRRRWPRPVPVHLPSVAGRVRADRGALLLTAAVVTLSSLLAAAVPVAMHATADRAVTAAVVRAGADADVVVQVPLLPDDPDAIAREREGNSAQLVDEAALQARGGLDRRLAAVLDPPVATVTSVDLTLTDAGPGRVFTFGYLAGGGGARVTWTAGGPPAAAHPTARVVAAYRSGTGPWPVQVGLSERTAALLGVRPGDRIPVEDPQHNHLDVRVSGLFRAVDPHDIAWRVVPRALTPATGVRTGTVGLLSRDSLPDGRLALAVDATRCTVTFAPRPRLLGWDDAAPIEAAAVAMKTSSAGSGQGDDLRFDTQLDAVLSRVRMQVAAASAQASVLLAGLIASAALVLLLAAELLVRRRAATLAGARIRGASLAGLFVELVVESAGVALAGAGCGLTAARLLTGGVAWLWPLPVLAAAVLAGPGFGVLVAARTTAARQPPANRSARLVVARTRSVRRIVLESAVIVAAVAAFVALHQRGVLPADPAPGPSSGGLIGGGGVLPALSPTLGAAAGALVLLRLVPVAVRFWLRRAVRSRGHLSLIAAARAASLGRALPLVALVVPGALLAVALVLAATQAAGQADGAWRDVGADARLDLTAASGPGPVLALASRLAGARGVRDVVTGSVSDVQLSSSSTTAPVHLVVLDAAAYRRLLSGTRLPGAARLGRLGRSGGGASVPALLRTANRGLLSGDRLSLRSGDRTVALQRIGAAPPVGIPGGSPEELVVDAASFTAAGGTAVPNTIWVRGAGAARAVASSGSPATVRRDLLAARRSAPLATGLSRLAYLSAGLFLLLGMLAVMLGAAGSRPARAETAARLATLGLPLRDARWIAAGELTPAVVAGAVGGTLSGILLARASLGLLGLRLLTGQASDPAPVVPWVVVLPLLVFPLPVVVLVLLESTVRRRERLGLVLRAGNP